MDRREALTKLGAAGAIVAGGSMVLSSNAVANTESGLCVPPGLMPGLIPMTMSLTNSDKDLTITPTVPGMGVTINRVWSDCEPVAPTTGSVTFGSGTTGANVILNRRSTPPNKWNVGEQFTVKLQVTWSCVGAVPSARTYVLTTTLPAPMPHNADAV